MNKYLKYHFQEFESMKELLANREQAKAIFLKQDKYVFEKKEKLFKKKDL